MSLSHYALATPVAGRAHGNGRQVYGVSSDTLVRLASGLSEHCVKTYCGFAGLCFSGRTSLPSPYGSYSNGTRLMTNWGEKNKQLNQKTEIIIVQTKCNVVVEIRYYNELCEYSM